MRESLRNGLREGQAYAQQVADAIRWAYNSGVVEGRSATTFVPDASVTREELATMIYRYCVKCVGMPEMPASLSGISDANKVSSWGQAGIEFCFAWGIMGGYEDDTIRPQGKALRCHLAKILTVTHTLI